MPTPRQGYYNKAGVPIPGCTSILSSLAGAPVDALLGWAAKLARDGLDWKSERERSANTGTWIHDALEHYPDPLPPRPAWMTDEEWTKAQRAYTDYAQWDSSVKPRILHQEIQLVSEAHQAGGTFDMVIELNGVGYLADHKTGKTIDVPKVAAQLSFYAAAALETGLVKRPIERGLILHYTPRGLKPIELSPTQMNAGLELFKLARAAYRAFKEFPR